MTYKLACNYPRADLGWLKGAKEGGKKTMETGAPFVPALNLYVNPFQFLFIFGTPKRQTSFKVITAVWNFAVTMIAIKIPTADSRKVYFY